MKYIQLIIITSILASCSNTNNCLIDTSDIQTFWNAYDQIKKTSGTLDQIKLIDSLYFQKGSEGLPAICEARRYTPESYIDAINKYPKYWESIRSNTMKANDYAQEICQGVEQLEQLYPELKPAKIYFTIGALRTGGTALGNKVLIGAELALADSTVVTTELKEDYPYLVDNFQSNKPRNNVVFNNVHEYVHTQQNTTIANSLLSRTLIEGVAEFIAEKSMNIPSPSKSMIFGKKNDKKIKDAFVKEMFTQFERIWFWANANNQFKIGDLGYYVGYAICNSYYENADNKKQAIKIMIELDYLNEIEIHQFIDDSKYFEKTISEYNREFVEKQPRIIGISEFNNRSKNVDPKIKTMTIEFSERMNTEIKNLRLGPLGEEHLLTITDLIGWSEDGRKITYEIELKSHLQQQLLVTDIFRSEQGYLLKPYLIDITTK